MPILHFASLLGVLFLQCGLQKYTFQVVSFRIERTINLLRHEKVLKLISLCNLHPRTKESCWRLLDSRLLATTAYFSKQAGPPRGGQEGQFAPGPQGLWGVITEDF